MKSALTPDELAALADGLGLADGDIAVLAAGKPEVVAPALGVLRLELARQYVEIPKDRYEFVWVTEFPLFEWGAEDGRWYSTHHPFTSPDPRDLESMESAPGAVRARAYDVVLNGTELGGGSIRIHDSEVQSRVFRLLGIEAERITAVQSDGVEALLSCRQHADNEMRVIDRLRAPFLARENQLCIASSTVENLRGDDLVVKYDVGALEHLQAAQRQEAGVSRAGADEKHRA